MFAIYYAVLWNGQRWWYQEEPVFWEGMCEEQGIMPLCHDSETY